MFSVGAFSDVNDKSQLPAYERNLKMKRILFSTLLVMAVSSIVPGQTANKHTASTQEQSSISPVSAAPPMFIELKDAKWSGDWAILRVDPVTKATQLLIRLEKNDRVPRHWHTANETITVISGTFIMECEGGKREVGKQGSFFYIPHKMIHQAWTAPDEGALLFITVDGAWDSNWVDNPSAASPAKDSVKKSTNAVPQLGGRPERKPVIHVHRS